MADQNAMYSTLPTTPPGMEGLRTVAGGVVAPLVSGFQPPYVPQNQSTYGAGYAKSVNDSLYKELMSGVFQQMGQQLGNTVGMLPFVQQGAQAAGYTPTELRNALSGGLGGFGRTMVGSMVMPLVDSLLARTGISGGSFTGAANAAFAQRMSLVAPTYANPYDPTLQHQALSGASAMMQLVNGLISTSRDGNSTLVPSMAFTQGFDRGTVTQVLMQAAANGAFARDGMNFAERLTEAAGGIDIGMLRFGAGDFTGGGDKSNLNKQTAQKVFAASQEFAATAQEIMKAYGAMRDLLKRVDGLGDELAAVTGGQWNSSRAAARATHDAIRRLDATATIHNIDTNDAFSMLKSNRSLLQAAAGFDANMQYYGFDGGGMFSLPAQTELLSSIEDMITARGERGNPVLAERRRRQGVQAFARGQNTMAGRAAMLLAYGRQTGIFSEDEAADLRADLVSGDRGIMSDALNRLLVTEFGSGRHGRELMQDTMLMNGIMMRMSPEAGVYATQTILNGAANEYMRREGMTMSENRLANSRNLLREAGMGTTPSDSDIAAAVQTVAGALTSARGGGAQYGKTFMAEYDNRVASGMSRLGALQATVSAFKASDVTSRFSDVIDIAMNESMSGANERRFGAQGRDAMPAYAMASELNRRGWLSGSSYADIMDLIRGGRAGDALSRVNEFVSRMDPATQQLMAEISGNAVKRFEAGEANNRANRQAMQMRDFAASMGYGLDVAAGSYNSALVAARKYQADYAGVRSADDLARIEREFADATQDFRAVWGSEAYEALKKATASFDKGYLADMGKVALAFERGAVGTLGAFGYGSEMSGHFGGGFYSGNDPGKLSELKRVTELVAGRYAADSLGSAENRSTLAQDLIKGMYDKDYLKVLRVYGGDDLMNRLGDAGYNSAFEARSKAAIAFSEAHGDFADAMRQFALDMQGTSGAAGLSLARQLMDDVGRIGADGKQLVSVDDVMNQVMQAYDAAGKSWNPEQLQKIENAMKAKAGLGQAEFDVVKAAQNFFGKGGNVEELRVAAINRDSTEDARKKAVRDYAFVDDINFGDRDSFTGLWGKTGLGKARDALRASIDDVDQKIMTAAGISSIDKLPDIISSGAYDRYLYQVGRDEAVNKGNYKAARALEQTRAVLNEGKTQITGTLTITDGETQTTGFVNGSVNGLK